MTFPSDKPSAGEPHEAGGPHEATSPYGAEPPYGVGPAGTLVSALGNATWQVLLTAGVAAIALGVIVLAWSGATLVVIGALFGIYLLVSGIFQLAGAFGTHVPGHLRVLSFVTGALSILLGLICFRGPAQSILLLALWIGFGWLLRGIMLTAVAISHEGLPARGWQVFLGIITILGGIVLIIAPFHSIAALTLVAGIWLIALGVVEIVHGIQLRIRLRHLTS
ncbi:HdeD family acid-resistance protein [Streptantibioticus ferralitis]|uniref:HdeD family acid-resistance protein n=1 Tax=Streptantibioticus ferralitis TaxID=236510 RepID=A0ABT5YUV6_9ACTN|nr:HdeD family acid-resistance protein [Streptantibioticus ferralitis]MDF2255401.1 HdeD family acid-resistance protein [Streptantibioticus ferralitis]